MTRVLTLGLDLGPLRVHLRTSNTKSLPLVSLSYQWLTAVASAFQKSSSLTYQLRYFLLNILLIVHILATLWLPLNRCSS